MDGNPISYRDFFDFSDEGEIRKAIRDINKLKEAYAGFVDTVINGQLSSLAKQQAELTASIRDIIAASKDLNVTNKESQKILLEQAAAMSKYDDELEKVEKTKRATKQTEEALGNSVNGLNARLREQIAEYNKLDPTVEHNLARMLDLAKATKQTRDAIAQLTKETKLSSAAFTAAKGSYAALDAETKQLVQELKQLEGGMSGTNATANKLQAQIFANTEKLKQFDAAMNQNFRNVGNYKSAFQGLNVATSQVFRELPSAAISMNTFFLAISNNLPILFDELASVKKQIIETKEAAVASAAAMGAMAKEQAIANGLTKEAAEAAGKLAEQQALSAAQGTKSTSVLKAFASSLLSFNTLITVGITLLTFFGQDIINFFSGSTRASKKAAEENKKYADSLKEIERTAYSTAAAEVARMQLLARSASDTRLSYEQRIAAINELKKTWPEYFAGLEREAFLNNKAATAINAASRAIFAKAASEASLDKFKAASKAVSDVQEKLDETRRSLESLQLDKPTLAYIKAEERRAELDRAGLHRTKEYEEATKKTRLLVNQTNGQQLADYKKLTSALATYDSELTTAQIQQQNFLIDAQKSSDAVSKINAALLGTARTPAKIQSELEEVNKLLQHTAVNSAEAGKLLAKQRKLQDELDAAHGKQTKSQKELSKAESEFQQLLRKRIDVIKATAAADVAEAEQAYELTSKSTYDQIALEKTKHDIIVQAAEAQIAITVKGTKLYEDAVKQKEQAERTFAHNVSEINKRRLEEEISIMEQIASKREKLRSAQLDLASEQGALPVDVAANNIRLGAATGAISQGDAERKMHDLRVELLNLEIAQRRKAYVLAIEGTEDYYQKRKALLEKERELVNENADYEVRKAEEVRAKKAAIADASFQFVSALANAGTSLVISNYDVELDALQAQKEYELEIAGSNKEAKKRIEQQFAKEQSRIRRDQAEAAKFEALFDIAINTAQAVVKAVAASPTTFGLPFSAFAAATGLIQAGLVAARPLPRYKIGRGKGRSEFAEINEEGFELVERRGKMRVENAGRRTVTYLSSEDKVYTHKQSVELLAKEHSARAAADSFSSSLHTGIGVYSQTEATRENRLIHALAASGLSKESLTAAFGDSVARIPVEQHSFDEYGYRRFVREGNTLTQQLNQRQKLGGNG